MRRQRAIVVIAGAAMLLAMPACRSESPGTRDGKIDISVLYVGPLDVPRGPDFVEFLEKHFTKVGKEQASEYFKEEQAKGYDVIIVDMPWLRVSSGYARPTMTLRSPGAEVCSSLSLKTRYG